MVFHPKLMFKQFKNAFYILSYYLFYRGTSRFCPICGKSSRRFLEFGIVSRKDAQCPYCRSLERQRLLWIYLIQQTDFFSNPLKTLLHVAPESCLESRFRKHLGNNYITADLLDPHVMVKMDVTKIPYPNQSFDIIYCNHVLEHVPDDKRAIQEFYRVLKNNGWAILNVPIDAAKTFEDPAIVDPHERERLFGQKDHVRQYGPDYVDRLQEAGFKVSVFGVDEVVHQDEAVRMGLTAETGHIFYCTK
jgi:hypothetical protein